MDLFGFLNEIIYVKNPTLLESLTFDEKKEWSSFKIIRFLSMDYRFIDIVNIANYFQEFLDDDQLYKLLIYLIPKRDFNLTYLKDNKKENKYKIKLLSYIQELYDITLSEAKEYFKILSKDQCIEILNMYPIEEKEIKKIIKNVYENND